MDWPTAAVINHTRYSVMVVISTFISTRSPKK